MALLLEHDLSAENCSKISADYGDLKCLVCSRFYVFRSFLSYARFLLKIVFSVSACKSYISDSTDSLPICFPTCHGGIILCLCRFFLGFFVALYRAMSFRSFCARRLLCFVRIAA